MVVSGARGADHSAAGSHDLRSVVGGLGPQRVSDRGEGDHVGLRDLSGLRPGAHRSNVRVVRALQHGLHRRGLAGNAGHFVRTNPSTRGRRNVERATHRSTIRISIKFVTGQHSRVGVCDEACQRGRSRDRGAGTAVRLIAGFRPLPISQRDLIGIPASANAHEMEVAGSR